ncbi:YceI family protein [Geomonas subterranea]|uniref:YceI family protein n=1 Tax=Geomonas subterranea TaxID=2847989 RepID=A0ABX8LTF8_9BACT|nr:MULTISPECIES: YceI family protein [Geomonas]QXE92775.1 YceI family protein [Geomonas subterranea]QXM09121.1 YceI family protein [Geomonas subterranea]
MKTTTCAQLKELLASGALVIDVMTPEDYAACHVAGAHNACIYEMVFLDRIAELVPERNTELILYDATGSRLTAEVARDRLIQAGYHNVSVLEGGLAGLKAAGLPVETGMQPPADAAVADGSYAIDTEKSTLEWIGRNLNNRHHGTVAVHSGELVMRDGRLTAGFIVLDMSSIENRDLQDPYWRDLLVRHLKSEDFFAVERFPTATFRFTRWEPESTEFSEASEGTVFGELTIRGVTRHIGFPAVVAPQQDGSVKAHAHFDIDRTLWDAGYGSGKLFERLGMHLVHDLVTLELFILAVKNDTGGKE